MKVLKIMLVAVLVSAMGVGMVQARHHNKPEARKYWVSRDGLMHLISDQRGILEGMAEGKVPVDQTEFIRAANALSALFAMIPSAFKENAMIDESRAKPEIWQNWDDFVSKAVNNSIAAADIAKTAQLRGVDAAKEKMEEISCGSCHNPYRK